MCLQAKTFSKPQQGHGPQQLALGANENQREREKVRENKQKCYSRECSTGGTL